MVMEYGACCPNAHKLADNNTLCNQFESRAA